MNGPASNAALPSAASSVPNPMANIPLSPTRHDNDDSRPPSNTLSLTMSPPPSGMSPLFYNDHDDDDQAAKRINTSNAIARIRLSRKRRKAYFGRLETQSLFNESQFNERRPG